MLHFKKSKQSGFSLVYSLVIGLLCTIIVLSLISIEIQRKKYLIETQKSLQINEDTKGSDCNKLNENGGMIPW